MTGFIRPRLSFDGPFGAGSLGGSGYTPIPVPAPPVGTDGGSGGPTVVVDDGLGGDLANPGTGGSDDPVTGGAPTDGGTGTDGGGAGGGTGGGGTGGGGTGGGGTGGGGTGGGGTGGGAKTTDGLPGASAAHNPLGGPPSKLGLTPAHGQGIGAAVAKQQKHAHKH